MCQRLFFNKVAVIKELKTPYFGIIIHLLFVIEIRYQRLFYVFLRNKVILIGRGFPIPFWLLLITFTELRLRCYILKTANINWWEICSSRKHVLFKKNRNPIKGKSCNPSDYRKSESVLVEITERHLKSTKMPSVFWRFYW